MGQRHMESSATAYSVPIPVKPPYKFDARLRSFAKGGNRDTPVIHRRVKKAINSFIDTVFKMKSPNQRIPSNERSTQPKPYSQIDALLELVSAVNKTIICGFKNELYKNNAKPVVMNKKRGSKNLFLSETYTLFLNIAGLH